MINEKYDILLVIKLIAESITFGDIATLEDLERGIEFCRKEVQGDYLS